MPRVTRNESKGERMPPAAFWTKPIFAPSAGSAQTTAPPDGVRVAVQVFRRGVDDDVGAEKERFLEVRRRKRVVDDEADLRAPVRRRLPGDPRKRREIGDLHRRVRRRLDEDHPGPGADRLPDGVEIRGVDVVEEDAEARENLREEAVRPAVGVAADDDVVTGRDEREHHRRDRRHARGEGVSRRSSLERREELLEGEARRVLRPCVLVAGPRPAERLLHVRRGLEDRDGDRPGDGLGLLPGVDAECVEPGRSLFHGIPWRRITLAGGMHGRTGRGHTHLEEVFPGKQEAPEPFRTPGPGCGLQRPPARRSR